jgi:hypothetical protein
MKKIDHYTWMKTTLIISYFFEHHTYYPKHGLSDVELELSTTGFSIVAAVPDDGEVFSQGCEVVVDERKRASSIQGIDAS